MNGKLTAHDVTGLDRGDGTPYPAGTRIKMTDAQSEALGLAKPRKAPAASPPPEGAVAATKPRSAGTRKRSAPTRRS